MKTLSESLMDLAGRVKRLEDSAAAVQEKNRAALHARRDELDAAEWAAVRAELARGEADALAGKS